MDTRKTAVKTKELGESTPPAMNGFPSENSSHWENQTYPPLEHTKRNELQNSKTSLVECGFK